MMGEQQSQVPALAPLGKTQVIYVEGLGFIPIESGQDIPTAVAAAQAKRTGEGIGRNATLAQGPQAGQRLGLQLPGGESLSAEYKAGNDEMVVQAMPQIANLIAQIVTLGRAGPITSALVPAATRAFGNMMTGRPAQEGTVGEGLIGLTGWTPTGLGKYATGKGEEVARHTLLRGLPDDAVPRNMAERLGKVAVENRASVTPEGVKDLFDKFADASNAAIVPTPKGGNFAKVYYDPAKKLAADDIGWVANRVQELEDVAFKKGTKGGGPSAIAPGSGAVTTGVRALGVDPAAGQAIAPIIGAVKGNPARRMAFARNLYRPANLVDATTAGQGSSALAKLLAAYYQSLEQKPAPPQRRSPY